VELAVLQGLQVQVEVQVLLVHRVNQVQAELVEVQEHRALQELAVHQVHQAQVELAVVQVHQAQVEVRV
jgi:hypothetical protein